MVRGFSTKNPPVSLLHTFYWRLAPVTNCTYASHLVGLLTRLILQRRRLKTILINRFGLFGDIPHVTSSCKESTVNILLKAPLRSIEEQEVYAVPVFSRAEAAEDLQEYLLTRENVMLKVVPWEQAGRQNQLDSLSDPTVLGRRAP